MLGGMAMVVKTMVNGIDVDELRRTIGTAMLEPDAVAYQPRITHRWVGGARCRSEVQGFRMGGEEDTSRPVPFVLHGDEPVALLGTNEAPNATESLLHALAACVSTTFMYQASLKGVTVESLELEVEGDIDLRGFLGVGEDIPRGFQAIRMMFRVEADAPSEQLEELCALAQEHSPVYNTVTRSAPVTVELAG